jgi:hypothetical protein
MNPHDLLPSQSKDIFEMIVETGLNPGEFKFTEPPEPEMDTRGEWYTPDHYPKLLHSSSRYWFMFANNYASYTPGSETIEETAREIKRIAGALGGVHGEGAAGVCRVPALRGLNALCVSFVQIRGFCAA